MKAGIQKARIEDITHACGLSKGAFYLHFESKEALFRELVQALERLIDEVRSSREQAYAALIGRGPPGQAEPAPFVAELLAIDGAEDRKLLELLWDWRDVTDVLLRGAQGTEFETVLWTILDREVARVEQECGAMKAAHLVRDDVPGSVLGAMIVGTYLLVARRLSTLQSKPDFEPWVRALQSVITDGAASPSLRVHREAARRAAGKPPRPRRPPRPVPAATRRTRP